MKTDKELYKIFTTQFYKDIKKLCDPLQKELDKLTAEIDTIMNKPQ